MKKFELIAVHDGAGESATFGIYVEYDGEIAVDLPWPADWPRRVDAAFLREQGFKVIKA